MDNPTKKPAKESNENKWNTSIVKQEWVWLSSEQLLAVVKVKLSKTIEGNIRYDWW